MEGTIIYLATLPLSSAYELSKGLPCRALLSSSNDNFGPGHPYPASVRCRLKRQGWISSSRLCVLMYHLLYGLYQFLTRKDEFNVLILGVDGAGKVRVTNEVLTSPQISGVPLLLLANKQDADGSLTVQEIRENYEEWWGRKQNQNQLNARAQGGQDHHHSEANEEHRRMASLDVMGISALKGTGVRDAIDWIYIRVQTNRKRDEEDY
ncbi:ADP-ribosylation factor protein 3 [Serendipita sp. 407]|nr:ADP-ribosylation factor protein 3 [Serendipita sp. 407]